MNFRFFASLLLIASMLLGAFGCKSIRKAVEATPRLAAQVNNLQVQTEKSFDQGLINEDTARRATVLIKDKLNPAVAAYTSFVDELRRAYPPGTEAKPTQAQWTQVRTLFRAVSSAFVEVVGIFKLLSPEQSILVNVVVLAIQETIDIIAGAVAEIDRHIEQQINKGGLAITWQKLQPQTS